MSSATVVHPAPERAMGRKRDVLVLTPAFPPAVGGAELLAERVVERFQHCRCTVLALETPGARAHDEGAAFEVVRVRNGPAYGRRAMGRLTLRALREGSALRPDAVLSMHLRCGAAAFALRRLTGARWLQYFHARELAEWPRQARFAASRADHSVAVSSYTRDLVRAAGAAEGAVTVIPPGVELPDGPRADRDERPTILSISRLADPYKGHDVMLDALPRILEEVPRARWVVIGDGRLRSRWEDEAARRGLAESAAFLGRVSDDERDAWLDRAHVFALPARVPRGQPGGEGFGIVFLEAAAHGLPAVGGAEGGVTDAVDHGRTGLLVDPRDPGAVADATVSLLVDEARARAMGRAGARWAERFTWPAVAARVERLLLDEVRQPA